MLRQRCARLRPFDRRDQEKLTTHSNPRPVQSAFGREGLTASTEWWGTLLRPRQVEQNSAHEVHNNPGSTRWAAGQRG